LSLHSVTRAVCLAVVVAGCTAAQPLPTPTDRVQFKGGDQVVVANPEADGVDARDAPNLGGKVLRRIPNGTQLTIQGGPTTADGYDWYPTQIVPDQDVKNAFVPGFALRRR
jgi:hypothetical protein